jgi:competence protein CoiA
LLTAANKNTDQIIDITEYEHPKLQISKEGLVCPECGWPLYIKAGSIVIPHFCHMPNAPENCTAWKNESLEHDYGKLWVRDCLRREYAGKDGVFIVLEKWISEIHQRADILVTYPFGWQMAHEIQLSPISLDEIKERTHGYESAGIDVIWWLTEKSKRYVEQWVREYFGQVFVIEIERNHGSYSSASLSF